jgi:long-chain acyl-CoA synthetase
MEKIWLKSYPPGVPAEVNADINITIIDIFKEVCEKFSSKPAFYNFGKTLTYQELAKQSEQFAAFLQHKYKLEKGARVAIMLPNILQYPIALFGILQAGYIVVNINPLYTPSELAHQLKDSGAETIIVLANFAHTLEKALSQTNIKNIIITEIGDCLGIFKKNIFNFVIKFIQKKIPKFFLDYFAYTKIFSINKTDKINKFNPVKISSDDTAFLQYTGGTTGVAKGAMLSHRNVASHMLQIKAWISSTIEEGKEAVITALPLYHIFSLSANCLTFMEMGGLNILITNPRDMNSFIKELKKNRFTVITGVNTLFNALLNHPDFAKLNFSHLHLTVGGGMAIQQSVAERWQKITGNVLLEAYGLTEASPGVLINPFNLEPYNGSAGLPFPSTEISIRDDNDQEVNIGETGELCIKGPQVMKSYWHHPEETKLVFTSDGWLRTGDIVKIDEKGYVYIIDRKKDMIIVSGFNVYPNEVEAVIVSHPGVLEVGVVGEPNAISGEIVKAVIVKQDPELKPEDIIRLCRTQLTGYKIPKKIEFRDSLPKSNIGKILRKALRR